MRAARVSSDAAQIEQQRQHLYDKYQVKLQRPPTPPSHRRLSARDREHGASLRAAGRAMRSTRGCRAAPSRERNATWQSRCADIAMPLRSDAGGLPECCSSRSGPAGDLARRTPVAREFYGR